MELGVPPKGSANDLSADYNDPKHMRAFREALLAADAPDAISAGQSPSSMSIAFIYRSS